jgi:hypothetical protein
MRGFWLGRTLKPAEEMNSGYTEVTKDFKQPGAESR